MASDGNVVRGVFSQDDEVRQNVCGVLGAITDFLEEVGTDNVTTVAVIMSDGNQVTLEWASDDTLWLLGCIDRLRWNIHRSEDEEG